ncbi:MAG TPA: hypothetical protein VG937_30215 [Polyangiaceae bacterium]|nr:hypothetical protein [Polyangiaceae bacterium]
MTKNFETLRSDLNGALAATEAAKQAAIERLKAEILQSEKTAVARAKELQAEFERELTARKAALAARVPAALRGPLSDFVREDTRAAAEATMVAWRSLDAEAKESCGCSLGEHHLVIAFARAKNLEAAAASERFYQGNTGDPLDAAAKVVRASDPATARARLLALESAVSTYAMMYPSGNPGYLTAIEGALGNSDLVGAGEEHHKAVELAARKRPGGNPNPASVDGYHGPVGPGTYPDHPKVDAPIVRASGVMGWTPPSLRGVV